MMKNRNYRIWMMAGVLLAGLSVSGFSEESGQPDREVRDEAVHVVYTSGGSEAAGGGVVISRLTSSEFLGIRCLVGTGVMGYMKDVKVRIPVDGVAMIMEYESLEAWLKSVQEFERPTDESQGR